PGDNGLLPKCQASRPQPRYGLRLYIARMTRDKLGRLAAVRGLAVGLCSIKICIVDFMPFRSQHRFNVNAAVAHGRISPWSINFSLLEFSSLRGFEDIDRRRWMLPGRSRAFETPCSRHE